MGVEGGRKSGFCSQHGNTSLKRGGCFAMGVDGCPTSPGGVGGAGNKFSQARVVPNALSTKSGFCWVFFWTGW